MQDGTGADLSALYARLDARHREDPGGGELAHALAVVAWIPRLRPDASAALQVAARAQHLGRWRVPRESYPPGRSGYLRWRADLQRYHADAAAAVVRECGFHEAFAARVRALMRKENLRGDPETRALEDALCLVFIEHRLADFSRRQPPARLERIVRKTWAKMSPDGRRAAVGLQLPDEVRRLLERALA